MEEEYRIVNGFKLPPKRHTVVKRKTSSNSAEQIKHPATNVGDNQVPISSGTPSSQGKKPMGSNPSLPFGAIRTVFVELKEKYKCKDIVFPEQPEFQKKMGGAC